MVTRTRASFALAATLLALTPAAALAAYDPVYESKNYSKIGERQSEYSTPEYQALLAEKGVAEEQEAATIIATDPERNFTANLCWQHGNGCAGDVRLYDWQANGHGIVEPVLFTARNGATLSGHVWATKAGPSKRPGIVITNGSVQAPEQLYWFAATTLAKRGYVVLTYDPQGQGRSDTFGEGADRNEGVPSQAGRPFFDGTEDALDFMLSNAKHPYEPRKSCTTGTSHEPKQDRRVESGLNAAYNPLWKLLDRARIGLAGHSFGASGVSFVGQKDPRVKAIVAWDNLSVPSATQAPCPADPGSRTVPLITKPALGMSADYFLTPTPYTSEPDPQGKSAGSNAYSKAGVDTGELIIRGGTHYEFSYIPNQAFGATLRGMDLVAWYTGAWFDKYVKGDATADRRLLTGRWRDDAGEAAVDPDHDGNQFSRYYRSRLDIGLTDGGRADCEGLRAGCSRLVAGDGEPANYSYLEDALTPDGR